LPSQLHRKIEENKKKKKNPLVKAGTSSHGLVITGCCPLLYFETKPSVSVWFFFGALIVLKMVFWVSWNCLVLEMSKCIRSTVQFNPLNVTWILKSQRKVDKNYLP
jgi:hypothetical protein